MTTYVPAQGKRIPMPNGQPDWPKEGREVNLASTYEARLVADGDLVKAEDKQSPPTEDANPNEAVQLASPTASGRNK